MNKDFSQLINEKSRENVSNTPDFILGEFLNRVLENVESLIRHRDSWYSIAPEPGRSVNEKFIGIASRIWCDPDMKKEIMDVRLAEKIALLLQDKYGDKLEV